jgi:hypothetical protein
MQPEIDEPVMEQLTEYCSKIGCSASDALNEAVRYWLETIALVRLVKRRPMNQLAGYSKQNALPTGHLLNGALRCWLDDVAGPRVEQLGLTLTPRFESYVVSTRL